MTAPAPARHMTVSDVAERLQVSTDTVRRLIQSGKLKASRVGRSLRVDPADLERSLKKWQVSKTAYSMVSGDSESP